ncbi:MAG: phage major capsid protein [Reyranellaceae bacterium]
MSTENIPTTEEFKGAIDKLGRAFEDYKKANDEALKKHDVVTDEKVARIDAELNKLSALKDAMDAGLKAAQTRADDLEKRFGRPGGPGANGDADVEVKEVKTFNLHAASIAQATNRAIPAPVDVDGLRAYKSAFSRSLKVDPRVLTVDEMKALQIGVQADGGFTVPPDLSGRIVTRVFETSPIRQIASVQTIGGSELKGVVDRDQAGAIQWGSETAAPTDSTTPQIGEWSIPANEGRVMPKATQQILEDSNIDIEAWLSRKVADRITRGQNDAFVNGTGVGRPRGFTTYTTAATADSSRTWGTIEHKGTGVSGDFASTSPADILFDLIGAMNPRYLANAKWVTRREVITKVRKFKGATTGDYLWQPGLVAGAPNTILGFPIVIAMDMPALGSASLSMAFGDFSEGYQIVDRVGMTMLRDPYSSKPYVLFYTRFRLGGDVVDFDAIKFVKFS